MWYIYDYNKSSQGGRRSEWARRWPIWTYLRDYFPIELVKTTALDPKRNYLFCFHPHGVMSAGAFVNFSTEATGFSKKFPGLTPYLLVLRGQFQFPLHREYFMLSGVADCTKQSIEFLLKKNGVGNAPVLVVGGAPEALEAHPGRYTLNLKNRKGFIKIAMQCGVPMVPVFSFGENDYFQQTPNPPGSRLRWLQDMLTKHLGFSPPVFHGRGVFNYTFGLIPFRRPVTTVVGAPIEVPHCDSPSTTEINKLHDLYIQKLKELFDENKTHYGKDSQHLVIS